MKMSVLMFTTVVTILIGTKCINSDQAYPMLPATFESQPSAKSETPETISKVDPLPSNVFTPLICEFLSPDMFSHRDDPLTYFFTKATKPSEQQEQLIDDLNLYITRDKFPRHYWPYAKLALSFLRCMKQLENIRRHVQAIQKFTKYYRYFDLSILIQKDADLLPIFSPDIFASDNPVLYLIKKLLMWNVSENEMYDVRNELKNTLATFGRSWMYFDYASCLYEFFNRPNLLMNLGASADEMQRILKVEFSLTKGINFGQAYPIVPITVEARPSVKSETAETVSEVDPLSPIVYTPLIREFLSPDMFSHRDDLLTYFFSKASKLSKQQDELIDNLNLYITNDKLPDRYVPYAKLAFSLLRCMKQLGSVGKHVRNVRKFSGPNMYSSLPISIQNDVQLLPMFSPDIFSSDNPVLYLIRKLLILKVSENDMKHMRYELKNNFWISDGMELGMVFGYAMCLYDFFDRPHLLVNLEINVDKMQRILKADFLHTY